MRHIRAAHKVHNLCIFPGCKFAWTRRYLYNAHVKTQHSDGNRGKVLGKSARSPPASKMIERSHRPPSFCRRSQAELGRRPLTQVTQVPFRAMSPVVYDAQPKYAEPAIMTLKHEFASGLELFCASNGPPAVSPTDEYAQSGSIANQGGQVRMVHAFVYAIWVISDPWFMLPGCRQPAACVGQLHPIARPARKWCLPPSSPFLLLVIMVAPSLLILCLNH